MYLKNRISHNKGKYLNNTATHYFIIISALWQPGSRVIFPLLFYYTVPTVLLSLFWAFNIVAWWCWLFILNGCREIYKMHHSFVFMKMLQSVFLSFLFSLLRVQANKNRCPKYKISVIFTQPKCQFILTWGARKGSLKKRHCKLLQNKRSTNTHVLTLTAYSCFRLLASNARLTRVLTLSSLTSIRIEKSEKTQRPR